MPCEFRKQYIADYRMDGFPLRGWPSLTPCSAVHLAKLLCCRGSAVTSEYHAPSYSVCSFYAFISGPFIQLPTTDGMYYTSERAWCCVVGGGGGYHNSRVDSYEITLEDENHEKGNKAFLRERNIQNRFPHVSEFLFSGMRKKYFYHY